MAIHSEHVRFGGLELDLSTGELRSVEASDPENPSANSINKSNRILLREQVFQVLRMLVEREGALVTREEIKRRLWANDTVVDFDQSINATVKALRRNLRDSADNPSYIETSGRRGYRLMQTIEYLRLAPAKISETQDEGRELSAAKIGERTVEVQRQMNPDRRKTTLMLASAVILLGVG